MAKKGQIQEPYTPSQLISVGGTGIVDNFNKFRNSPEGKFQFQNMEQNRIAKKSSGRVEQPDVDPIDLVTDIAAVPLTIGRMASKQVVKNIGRKIFKKESNLLSKTISPIVESQVKKSTPYYHGSPWNWDTYDPSTIGKAEGLSLRGKGLNLSERPNISAKFANIASDDAPIHIGRGVSKGDKTINPTVYEFTPKEQLNFKQVSGREARKIDQQKLLDEGYHGIRTEDQVTVFPEHVNKLNMSKKSTIQQHLDNYPDIEHAPWNKTLQQKKHEEYIMKKKFRMPQKKAVGGEVTTTKKLPEQKTYIDAVAKAPTYNQLSEKFGNFQVTDPSKKKALQEAWDRDHPKPREGRSSMPTANFAVGGEVLDRMDAEKYDATGALANGAVGAATQFATGNIVGGIASLAGTGISMLLGSQKARKEKALADINNSRRDLQMATQGMAKGGKVKGPGTGTSDSIPAKLDGGDFIVPAENASKAMEYGIEYLGWKKGQTATTQDGATDVAVSNGEVRFTTDEVAFLKKEMGINLNKLAPNAEGSDVKQAAKGKLSDPKELAKEKIRRDEYWRLGLGGKNAIDVNSPDVVTKRPTPIKTDLAVSTINDTLAKKYIPKDVPKKKIDFSNLAEKYGGAAIGAAQTIVGGISALSTKNKIDKIPNIKGPGAAYNTAATEMDSVTNKAVNQIMTGVETDADRAMGNYSKIAKESGGSNSANVLAGAAKVGQSSSDSYLKGMTAATQLKLAGTEASSKIRTEGALKQSERELEIQAMNLKNKRDQLNNALGNANAAVGAGTTNIVNQFMENKYQRDLAKSKAENDRVNTTSKRKGGFINKLKALK